MEELIFLPLNISSVYLENTVIELQHIFFIKNKGNIFKFASEERQLAHN